MTKKKNSYQQIHELHSNGHKFFYANLITSHLFNTIYILINNIKLVPWLGLISLIKLFSEMLKISTYSIFCKEIVFWKQNIASSGKLQLLKMQNLKLN
jgi:hypothetical protein